MPYCPESDIQLRPLFTQYRPDVTYIIVSERYSLAPPNQRCEPHRPVNVQAVPLDFPNHGIQAEKDAFSEGRSPPAKAITDKVQRSTVRFPQLPVSFDLQAVVFQPPTQSVKAFSQFSLVHSPQNHVIYIADIVFYLQFFLDVVVYLLQIEVRQPLRSVVPDWKSLAAVVDDFTEQVKRFPVLDFRGKHGL